MAKPKRDPKPECTDASCPANADITDYAKFTAGLKQIHQSAGGTSSWSRDHRGGPRTFHHGHMNDVRAWEEKIDPTVRKREKMKPPTYPQEKKPMEKVRLFHGTPKTIKDGVIKPTKQRGEEWGGAGPEAAFATEDLHDAASHAGVGGHIYEVDHSQLNLRGDAGYYHFEGEMPIKQEVGFPGHNLPRQNHFSLGHDESRK